MSGNSLSQWKNVNIVVQQTYFQILGMSVILDE